MEMLINIKVFDPAWLVLTKDEIDYRKQIKEPEDIDIEKYKEGITFKFDFDIKHYTANRNTEYPLEFTYKNPESNGSESKKVTIQNISLIEFFGEKRAAKVIVSNDLIHGDFQAKKSAGKLYYYIYLDGHFEYLMLNPNIWLSKKSLHTALPGIEELFIQPTNEIVLQRYLGRK